MKSNQGVTVATIAKQMKIDPKNARAKLRRNGVPASHLLARRRNGRMEWLVKPTSVAFIKQQLKHDGRKAS